jgi:hypothetical protein
MAIAMTMRTSHRRRPRLGKMALRPVVADLLPDAHLAEPRDHRSAQARAIRLPSPGHRRSGT